MDNFFSNYPLKGIETKTKISPTILKKLRDNDFDGISKVKVQGFIKILENEYPECDFSNLIKKQQEFFSNKIEEEPVVEKDDEENEITNNNLKTYLTVGVLVIMIISLIYYIQSQKTSENLVVKSVVEKKIEVNTTDRNITEKKRKKVVVFETVLKEVPKQEIKQKQEKNVKKEVIPFKVVPFLHKNNNLIVIVPVQKVWFKVFYLDSNKSKEYLTSHKVELNTSERIFIKFGHGMEKIIYDNKTVFPNTKRITRIIIQNKEINLTNKRLRAFQ